MPARVAFVDHAVEIGGAQKSLTELLARLDPARYEPVILHARGARWLADEALRGIATVETFESAEVLAVRRAALPGHPLGALRKLHLGVRPVTDVLRALKAAQPDLVHTNSLKCHIIGGIAARLARKPLVWHVRDIVDGNALRFLRFWARRLRPHIIAVSHAAAAQFAGLPIPVTVIHNGVPLERFTPGEPPAGLREALGLGPTAPVIVIVSRLTPWKGHRTLLEAMVRLRETWPEVALLVVGAVAFWDAGYEDELKQYAADLGLGEAVRWLGEREDVAELLRLADVFCLPSRQEPFGRAIVEAMAVGKPVVACRSGGVPEVVVEGETGLLVADDAPEELAEALATVLASGDLARRLGEAGHARAQALFASERVAEQVQAVYDGVLGRKMSVV